MNEWIRHAACAGFVVLAAGTGAAGDPDSQSTAWERFKAYTRSNELTARITSVLTAQRAVERDPCGSVHAGPGTSTRKFQKRNDDRSSDLRLDG